MGLEEFERIVSVGRLPQPFAISLEDATRSEYRIKTPTPVPKPGISNLGATLLVLLG